MSIIKITLPKGFMNAGISTEGVFIANNNRSTFWNTMRIELPPGEWVIKSARGREVVIKKVDFVDV